MLPCLNSQPQPAAAHKHTELFLQLERTVQYATISQSLFSLCAHPKPPPSLIPACISVLGKKRQTQSHKHARLGQSWFHNHSMTSLLSPSFSFSFPFCLSHSFSLSLLQPLLLILLLSTFCRPICPLFGFALFSNVPYPPLSFYVLYLHTLSPTL